MRILVDVRHLKSSELSGVGQYTVHVLRALFRIAPEHTYVLLTSCAGAAPKRVVLLAKEAIYAEHVHLSVPNKRLNLELFFGLGKTLDERAGGGFDLAFLPNLNIVRLSKDLPYVLTVHDASWKLFPEFFSKRMLLWHAACRPESLIQQATELLVPSEATKEDVERLFAVSPEKVHVIPHGISVDESPLRPTTSPSSLRSGNKAFALFVGTREPRKNLPLVVEAVQRYRERFGDDLRLVVAGGRGWGGRSIDRLLASHTWINVLGYVSDEERTELYRKAKFLFWPSLYEGFGLPALEAMAHGCPVITSTSSSLPELVGTAAILVNPFDTEESVEAIRAVMTDEALRTRFIQAGKERAKAFSWEASARATARIFQNFS